MKIEIDVNSISRSAEVEARTSLADCLRDEMRLTGTHVGCEHGVCGACTVLLDGHAVRSCLVLAVQARGRHVVTVEGLSNAESLTPLQQAFRNNHALQCGFCTPGAIVTAHALLAHEPDADTDRILEVMSGNFCRWTAYLAIINAVHDARDEIKKRSAS